MSVSETMSDNGRCRLCVREKPNQISVFRRNLSMRIMKLADVVIREDDWLPKTICLDCEIDIEKCFEFIARIQWADKKFRDEANQIEVEESIFIKQEHCQFENFMEEDCDDVQDHCDSKIQDESDKLPAETKDEIGQSAEPFNLVEIIKDEERLDLMEENEERSNNAEAAKDPLSQGEPFLEVQGRDEYAPAIDPLICLKEEAEAVDLAPSTSTKSSSVRQTTSTSSIPIRSEITPQPRGKFEIKRMQKTQGNVFVMDHMYPETLLTENLQSTLDQDGFVCSVGKFKDAMQQRTNFSNSQPVSNYIGSIPSGQDKETETTTEDPVLLQTKSSNIHPIINMSPYCSTCNIDFSCMDELNKHKEALGVICRVCTSCFERHDELEKHIVTHQSSTCRKCNKVFYTRKDVMDHRKTSVSCGEELECEYCKKICFDKKALSLHKRRFHISRELNDNNKCVVCLRRFKLPSLLTQHLKVAHVVYELIKCKFCDRSFLGPQKLRDHIKASHISRPIETHVCSTCGKSFQKKQSLYAHSKIHDESLLLCHLCGKPSKGIAALSSHMIHEHKNSGSFTCDCCNKHFTRKKSFLRHVKYKTQPSKATEVYCEICGKKFKSKFVLKNHQLIHSGERPFKCEICSATFVQLVSLKTHSRIHSNVNPYLCKLCGESFRWKQTFDKHLRKCDSAEFEDEVSDSSSSNQTSNVG